MIHAGKMGAADATRGTEGPNGCERPPFFRSSRDHRHEKLHNDRVVQLDMHPLLLLVSI